MNDLINVHGSGPVEIVPREAASPERTHECQACAQLIEPDKKCPECHGFGYVLEGDQ